MLSRLRWTIVVAVAVGCLTAPALPAARSGPISSVDSLEVQLLAEVNATRSRYGLSQLTPSPKLAAAAQSHSREMGERGYFGHASVDGTDPVSRVGRYYTRKGYRSWWVGENLAWWSPTIEANDVVKRWLASPVHRKELLTPRWREIGISAIFVQAAPGVFKGMDATIITANFGMRSRSAR
jgi:uncharacterized protein YkwD